MKHVLLTIALLAGCVTPQPVGPSSNRDDFTHTTTHRSTPQRTSKLVWMFLGVVPDGEPTSYALGMHWRGDWFFPEHVLFADGTALEVVVGDSGVTRGQYPQTYEYFYAPLEKDWLTANRASGAKVRLIGQRGSVDLDIPPAQFEEILTLAP